MGLKILSNLLGVGSFLNRIWDILWSNETLLIGIVTAIGVTFGNMIKDQVHSALSYLRGKLLYVVEINSDSQLFNALDEWYYENYPGNFRDNLASFKTSHENDGTIKYTLKFTPINSLAIINHGSIKMGLKKETEDFYDEGEHQYEHTYILTGFNSEGVKDFLSFLEQYWNEKNTNKGLKIMTGHDRYSTDTIYRKHYKTFNELFFEQKDYLLSQLDMFADSKEIYNRRKIKYKLGVLLAGPAGTGKSNIALAIAAQTKRPIIYINPGSFVSDMEFQNRMSNLKGHSVILMEDVDSYFGDRENDNASKINVSFSSILNVLDGIFSPEDVIIVMTTNYPDLLDNALKRKGRLDLFIDIDYARGKHINQYVRHYFQCDTDVVDDSLQTGVPMVDIEFICRESESFEQAKYKIQRNYGRIRSGVVES